MHRKVIKITIILMAFLSGCNNGDIVERELQPGKRLSTSYYDYNIDNANYRIMILAGVHGNERSGVYYLNNLIEEKKFSNRKGIGFLIIPIANSEAYKENMRYPYYLNDLNRNFPGKSKGTETQELAYEIMEIIRDNEIDLVIDLHEWNLKDKDINLNGVIINKFLENREFIRKITGLENIVVEEQAIEGSLIYSIADELNIDGFILEANQAIDREARIKFYDDVIKLIIEEKLNGNY
ncbi:MAG: succinylglutamate desuccinylase/aspartoacylase family protein [Tissierellia bacterium]|nr:succinylglutamate desuccinylase/aspartoacylase family protein [Tissierellia bacterium]